jgi:hypothetical protein
MGQDSPGQFAGGHIAILFQRVGQQLVNAGVGQ